MPGAARSRSLWDQTLALPDGAVDGAYDIAGPERHRLTTLTRTLKPEESESGALRLAVAADTAALAEPVGRFNHMLLIALGALAAGLTAAAVVQVLVGLRPLARLRAQLASQRAGGVTPIEDVFPAKSSLWSRTSTACWRSTPTWSSARARRPATWRTRSRRP